MDPKQLALAHFEKIILGAFALWLAFVGVGFVIKPAELQKNDQLVRQMRQIGSYMNGAQPPDIKAPDWAPKLRRQLDPKEVDQVGSFNGWVMHRRPQFLYGVEATGPTHAPTHEPPVDVTFDTEQRGKVVIKWKPSVDNEYIIVAKYEIERRKGEEGKWELVGSVDGLEESYEDTDVESRVQYFYRVISIAEIDRDNPVVDAEGLELPEKAEKQVSAVTGPATTARDMYILPITVQQVTREDLIKGSKKTESAYIRVYKWDSEAEKFEEKAFNVKVGEKIGKKVKKRRKTIDFGTGATLKDVEIKQRKHKLGHNEQVQWIQYEFPDGTVEEATDKDIPEELKK